MTTYLTAKDTRTLAIGTLVFCTVRGPAHGWYTLHAIRPRDGYIQISGSRRWCPPHNFRLTDDAGKEYRDDDGKGFSQ